MSCVNEKTNTKSRKYSKSGAVKKKIVPNNKFLLFVIQHVSSSAPWKTNQNDHTENNSRIYSLYKITNGRKPFLLLVSAS